MFNSVIGVGGSVRRARVGARAGTVGTLQGMPGRGKAKELFSDCEQSFGRLSICSHHRDFSMSSTLSFIWLVIFKSTHLLKLETTFKGVFCLFTCQNKCVKCG